MFGEGSHLFLRRPGWGLAIPAKPDLPCCHGDWHIDAPSGVLTAPRNTAKACRSRNLESVRNFVANSADRKNHYWFVRALAEYQQWHSDRMAPTGGTPWHCKVRRSVSAPTGEIDISTGYLDGEAVGIGEIHAIALAVRCAGRRP